MLAGLTFLMFAVLTIKLTYASGRLAQPAVLVLISVMVVLSAGFLEVAFATLRRKEKRRAQLLGRTTLLLIGGFLVFLPLLLLGVSIWMGTEAEVASAVGVLSLSSLGLLAIRLARIRKRPTSL